MIPVERQPDDLRTRIAKAIAGAVYGHNTRETAWADLHEDAQGTKSEQVAYEQMKHLHDDAGNIAKYAFGERRTVQISERGMAIVESGLTVRQAHEIKTGCSQDDLCAECKKGMETI